MVLDAVQTALQKAASQIAGEEVLVQLTHPKDESHGDFATAIALQLSKKLGQPPLTIAQQIIETFEQGGSDTTGLIHSMTAVAPGFINITLELGELPLQELKRIISEGTQYGQSTRLSSKTYSIEHTSPNPNKAMHLGHLRNNVTGMAISNMWEAQGVTVIRDCIDNNRGIAIAKLMWGYLKFARKGDQPIDVSYWYEHQSEWNTPFELGTRPDRFVDELYVQAAQDSKEHPEIEQQVRQFVVDWEAHDEKNWALWEKVLGFSYAGQEMTLKRLGNKYDKVWHEHEHYQKGKDLVELGLKKGIFTVAENGTILTNLESMGLTDTVVQKSDGTSLYITQDLALTKLKKETFHADKMFWVIGPEQSLAMKQVFAVCEQLGIGKRDEFVHIPFGYMSIKGQGKMSSRAGNVVYIDSLIDQAKDEVLSRMEPGNYASEDERLDIAEKIAIAAVKYSILHVGRLTNTAFDFATSLALEGDSGPYLLYTYARCRSVEAKVGDARIAGQAIDDSQGLSLPSHPAEIALTRWLYRYPEVVAEAAEQMSPNLVSGYMLELGQRFNAFYGSCNILGAENVAQGYLRLQLTRATAQVLKNGLALLGISTVERM
jgi:arginyl-tRNA synthetase